MFLLASHYAVGQNTLHNSDYSQRYLVGTGIDPSWNVSFSYQRIVNLNGNTFTAYGEWEASVVRPGFKNCDGNLGAVISLLRKNNFHVLTDPYFSLGRLETRNFKSLSTLVGNEVSAGFFKVNKYITLLVSYNRILATHLEHSNFYRETFFEDARDAWYRSTGGFFQFGLGGGFTFNSKHDIFIEFKIPVTERFGGFGGSPAHLNLGYGIRI